MRLGASVRHTTRMWPHTPSVEPTAPAEIRVGALVDVRNRFDDSWTPGFAITAMGSDNCQVRRVTDDAPLPVWFAAEDVRPSRAA